MPALSTWNLDPAGLLTHRELATVLGDLASKAGHSADAHRNLVVVPLACCCGLRVSEMAALQPNDALPAGVYPNSRRHSGAHPLLLE